MILSYLTKAKKKKNSYSPMCGNSDINKSQMLQFLFNMCQSKVFCIDFAKYQFFKQLILSKNLFLMLPQFLLRYQLPAISAFNSWLCTFSLGCGTCSLGPLSKFAFKIQGNISECCHANGLVFSSCHRKCRFHQKFT